MANLTITWQISTVDIAGFSTWPSVAYSPGGQASIAYHSSNFDMLRLATLNVGGTWDIEAVDIGLKSDSGPSLLYRFGQPAVSYAFGFEEIRYALRRGGTPPWTVTTVVSPSGSDHSHAIGAPSLALGPSHRPGISFGLQGGGVGYRQQDNPAVWTGSTVDPEGRSFNSLAYTPSGKPAVAYSASDGSNHDIIKYAEWDGSHWLSQTVGPGAGWCTFLFTPAGEPALVYPDSVPNGSVIYAVGNGGSWNLEKIANGADSPSLAFTPAGEPAISCYNYGGSVDYFVRHEGAWNRFVVEEAGKDQAGQLTGPYTFTSLAISPALGASPAIAYYDRATGGIKCAIGTVSLGFRGAGVTSAVRDLLSLP